MNSKNIAKSLNAKLTEWTDTIEDKEIKKVIKDNALITGGALVSLLNGETPNDYDVYFKTFDSCKIVSEYYADLWNKTKTDKKPLVAIRCEENKRVECFISSSGIAQEDGVDENGEPIDFETDQIVEDKTTAELPKYRPRFFSTNAISLSDGIQLVIRFFGAVDKIHENYDFIHCTCGYDWKENKVNLPVRALEAIINKELVYCGSKYPLCSLIRTRKFIQRGYSINAGQYVKMALQLNTFNLLDITVFKDQLVGVDSAYFTQCIENINKKQEDSPDFVLTNGYLIDLINKIF